MRQTRPLFVSTLLPNFQPMLMEENKRIRREESFLEEKVNNDGWSELSDAEFLEKLGLRSGASLEEVKEEVSERYQELNRKYQRVDLNDAERAEVEAELEGLLIREESWRQDNEEKGEVAELWDAPMSEEALRELEREKEAKKQEELEKKRKLEKKLKLERELESARQGLNQKNSIIESRKFPT